MLYPYANVSTLTPKHKPANQLSWLNIAMTLKERLELIMARKGWEQKDLVRISGQSSSVVSQWLGKGSKEIKSIGKMEAAAALEKASGFAALWIARGILPMHTQSSEAVTGKLQQAISRQDSISPRSQKTLETLLQAAERNVLTDEHWALLDELTRRFIHDRKAPRQ